MHTRIYLKLITVTMLISAFFFSCEKTSDVGLGVVPKDYLVENFTTDTFQIQAYTYPVDSVLTGNNDSLLLGSYIDPIFGEFRASIVTEIIPSKSDPDFEQEPIYDSTVLFLTYSLKYRYLNNPLQIDISQIHYNIVIDTTHKIYSNFNRESLNPEFITSTTFIPENNDTAILRIKMPYEFGHKILTDTTIWQGESFTNVYFNGFLIEPNPSTLNSSILNVDLFDQANISRLAIYYHYEGDTVSKSFPFTISSYSSNRFNMLNQVNNSPDFIADLENPEEKEDSILYLQGGAGLKIKIKIPYLNDLKEKGLYGVNRAELIVHSDPLSIVQQSVFLPPKMTAFLFINDEGESFVPIEFYNVNGQFVPAYFTGSPDYQYKIDITHHVQSILSGNKSNNGFYIMVADAAYNPARIVLTGGKHSSPMKLILTLTKIPD
ncbi:MAG: DUF4270 family protein [Bacteroidales bacterium]